MTLSNRDVQKNCSRTRVWTFNGTSAGDHGFYQNMRPSEPLHSFQPSLWEIENKTPVENPTDVSSKLPQMAVALVPHALRAVAGLYRLFWLETHPCHAYTLLSSPIPFTQGFGVPWNVFNSSELLLKAFCPNSSVIAEIGPATYVYNQGYVLVNNNWQPTTFTCTAGAIVSNAWCPQTAQGTLPNSSTYYIAYTCFWTGSEWKCGCRDTACAQSFWQQQRIQR